MSLNKVQVATSSDFCWENTCLCGYCLVSVCDTIVLPFVIDCKLVSEINRCVVKIDCCASKIGSSCFQNRRLNLNGSCFHQNINCCWAIFNIYFEGLLTTCHALFVPHVSGPGQGGETAYYCHCARPDQAHVATMSEELELGDDFEKAQSAIQYLSSLASMHARTSVQAGTSSQAGTSAQAGTNGQARTSKQAGTNRPLQAGASARAGTSADSERGANYLYCGDNIIFS